MPPYSAFNCVPPLTGVRLDGPLSFFFEGRLFENAFMAVTGIVDQEIKARRSDLSESVFHIFDEGTERCDVAGVQL